MVCKGLKYKGFLQNRNIKPFNAKHPHKGTVANNEDPDQMLQNAASDQGLIMKTRLYSIDPLKPLFYTVKLGFTGGIH